MRNVIATASVLFASAAFSMDLFEQYKSNYVRDMRPALEAEISAKYPKADINVVSSAVDKLVIKMAECQYKSTEGYPQKYRRLAIEPIANGISTNSMLETFNRVLQEDLSKGLIQQTQIDSMVNEANKKLSDCMKSS